MSKEINHYILSRTFFDFAFENPEKIRPNHIALYFFAIEHCNRLGWKSKFGLPSSMTMEAIGIKSYNTYINTLNDLISFGFITLIEKSKNQYSSNIIALSKFNKANDNALNNALITHSTKHLQRTVQSTVQSTGKSTGTIDKQITNNNKQITIDNTNWIDLLDENWRKILDEWFEYRNSIKKKINNPKKTYSHLLKISNNDFNTAKQIIDISIANSYIGLFPLKNNEYGKQITTNQSRSQKRNEAFKSEYFKSFGENE